jgi:hypothetical protein
MKQWLIKSSRHRRFLFTLLLLQCFSIAFYSASCAIVSDKQFYKDAEKHRVLMLDIIKKKKIKKVDSNIWQLITNVNIRRQPHDDEGSWGDRYYYDKNHTFKYRKISEKKYNKILSFLKHIDMLTEISDGVEITFLQKNGYITYIFKFDNSEVELSIEKIKGRLQLFFASHKYSRHSIEDVFFKNLIASLTEIFKDK